MSISSLAIGNDVKISHFGAVFSCLVPSRYRAGLSSSGA